MAGQSYHVTATAIRTTDAAAPLLGRQAASAAETRNPLPGDAERGPRRAAAARPSRRLQGFASEGLLVVGVSGPAGSTRSLVSAGFLSCSTGKTESCARDTGLHRSFVYIVCIDPYCMYCMYFMYSQRQRQS